MIKKIKKVFLVVSILIFTLLSFSMPVLSQTLTPEEVNLVIQLCSAGISKSLVMDVQLKLQKLNSKGEISFGDIGSIFRELEKDNSKIEALKLYHECVNNRFEAFVKEKEIDDDKDYSILANEIKQFKKFFRNQIESMMIIAKDDPQSLVKMITSIKSSMVGIGGYDRYMSIINDSGEGIIESKINNKNVKTICNALFYEVNSYNNSVKSNNLPMVEYVITNGVVALCEKF